MQKNAISKFDPETHQTQFICDAEGKTSQCSYTRVAARSSSPDAEGGKWNIHLCPHFFEYPALLGGDGCQPPYTGAIYTQNDQGGVILHELLHNDNFVPEGTPHIGDGDGRGCYSSKKIVLAARPGVFDTHCADLTRVASAYELHAYTVRASNSPDCGRGSHGAGSGNSGNSWNTCSANLDSNGRGLLWNANSSSTTSLTSGLFSSALTTTFFTQTRPSITLSVSSQPPSTSKVSSNAQIRSFA